MTRQGKSRSGDEKFGWVAFQWMGVGLEFCLVIGFFVFIGYLLDKLENTIPAWMILGFFTGFGLMLWIVVKRVKLTEREFDKDESCDDEAIQ